MKRIKKITINNYKAYYRSRTIDIPQGKNVLIYGENGSGKTSLYKAVRFFMSSSVGDGSEFELNQFSRHTDGLIELVFADYDLGTKKLIEGTESCHRVCPPSSTSTNTNDFIKLAYRVSGFLDYSKLLQVYNTNSTCPNLFDLVLDLIGEHIPIGAGLRQSIGAEYKHILDKARGSYHRSDKRFQEAKQQFELFKEVFLRVIGQLNEKLGAMMSKYFPDFNIQIRLNLTSLIFDEDCLIGDTDIKGKIIIEVTQYGQRINDYNSKLNEARLSAIAICLYLSSLKLRASMVDTKILYLDDVFIGLDMGNRKPVLNIIETEFTDYQKFISTYDLGWFNQAKSILSNSDEWVFLELFEGIIKDDATGMDVPVPILLSSESSYGKAYSYFRNTEPPDYPASANYLRKAFEELLSDGFHHSALREVNCEFIPAFNLTKLVDHCILFVNQINKHPFLGTIPNLLLELQGTLHPLLHPLSHYVPDIAVYKSEIRSALQLFDKLRNELALADFPKTCDVIEEKNHKVRFEINGDSGWKFVYDIFLEDNIYCFTDVTGNKVISQCSCYVMHIMQMENGQPPTERKFSKELAQKFNMRYRSLPECKDSLVKYLNVNERKSDIVRRILEEQFLFPDTADSDKYITLKDKLLLIP